MNFNKFTKLVESCENPVVLPEGSRNVLEKDAQSLTEFAVGLAGRFPQALFRSGGASASNDLFTQGVLQINREKMQFVLPKSRKADSGKTNTIFFDDLPESEQEGIFTLTEHSKEFSGKALNIEKPELF